MHELSIAESIVDIIHQYVEPEKLPLVRAVSVKVGSLSGVVPDSLEFGFTAITAGTPLADARLELHLVPFVLKCGTCNAVAELAPGVALCPECGSLNTTAVSGTELNVTEIELYEPEELP